MILSAQQLLLLPATEICRQYIDNRIVCTDEALSREVLRGDKYLDSSLRCQLELRPGVTVVWHFDDIVVTKNATYMILSRKFNWREVALELACIETAFYAAMHLRSEMVYAGVNLSRHNKFVFIIEFGKYTYSVTPHSELGVLEFFATKLKHAMDPDIAYLFATKWKKNLWANYFNAMIYTRRWTPTESYIHALNNRAKLRDV